MAAPLALLPEHKIRETRRRQLEEADSPEIRIITFGILQPQTSTINASSATQPINASSAISLDLLSRESVLQSNNHTKYKSLDDDIGLDEDDNDGVSYKGLLQILGC
ncbi:hypothetical protein LINPERPRIM_LOCUS5542 [Linum perenne]